MLFDDLVSQIFDEIIDWVTRLEIEIPFLEDIFTQINAENLLDIGCSTGSHAIALGRKGYNVTGIDYTNYAITTARRNLSEAYLPEGVSVRFYQDDFSVFAELTNMKYDGIMLLGNTLSLATTSSTIIEILRHVHRLLSNHGVLIIEVMNFGTTEENTHFKELDEVTVDGDPCIVQQGYFVHQGYGTYLFNVLRKKNQYWEYWLKENSQIYAFTLNRFEHVVSKAGFTVKSLYSSYAKEKFSDESENLLAVLVKS